MQDDHSANTVRAYKHCWLRFRRWCEEYGCDMLPAKPEDVCCFVTWCLKVKKLRIATVRLTLAAIKNKHYNAEVPAPIDDKVHRLLRNARKKVKQKSAAKSALSPELLSRMSQTLAGEHSPLAVRDRAILLVGFATSWRRSELAGLQMADVSLLEKEFELHLGVSKTDQEGEGRDLIIEAGQGAFTCPVEALRAWLKVRGEWHGPLFCRITPNHNIFRKAVTGDTINTVLKRTLKKIGENPKPYGAHSLRAGMVTASIENGASIPSIKHRTGHRNLATLLRYDRLRGASRVNPLRTVL